MSHVLIVEDHAENRNLLKLLLEVNGYRVSAAGDGLEALESARRDRPDVIVSDALMPNMDGFALCRAWMQDAALKTIPFVFYSATYVRPDDQQYGAALGAVRYLIKPLEAKAFLAELDAVLRQWAGRAAPAPAAPLNELASHALHESALARKLEDKMAQLEAAKRKLQESETRFRSLTEMSSDFYWESDAEHRLIQRTSAAKKTSAVSVFERGAQIGERRWEIPYLSPDEAGWAAHRAMLDAHLPFRDFVISRTGTDGSERFISISGDPLFDASGAFAGYCGVGTDITERKRTEEALRASEDRYRDLVENSRDLICTHDLEGRLLSVNAAVSRVSGYPREALLGKNLAELLASGGRNGFAAYLAEILAKGSARGLMRVRTAGGEMRWWEYDNTMRSEAVGAPIVRGMARDVTESKATSDALRDSEGRFRSLIEQSITGIYIIQDGKFTYVNPRMVEITGCDSAEALIGRDALSLVAEKDRDRVAQSMRERIEGEVPRTAYEFSLEHKDGAVIEVGVHSSRAIYQGRPAVIGLMQDISEKKRAEEKIQNYVAQLETAFMSTVQVATTLGEMRDPYTAGHQRKVAEIAVAIGAELGLDAHRQEGLRVAGYLHDVGKITIPAEILSKPGKLSPTQFQLIQGHAQASYEVLKDVQFPWPVAEVALQHHERADGSGYPQGLKGEA
ncbi:MAG: PAS domain S-box protein, partial [Pseudomonadota bacterium]